VSRSVSPSAGERLRRVLAPPGLDDRAAERWDPERWDPERWDAERWNTERWDPERWDTERAGAEPTENVDVRHADESADRDRVRLLRSRFTPAHLRSLALMLVVVVAAGVTLTLRARSESVPVTLSSQVTTEARASSQGSSGPPDAGSGSRPPVAQPSASSTTTLMQVHVTGEVRRPGVVRLAVGARVHEAIAAAGGATTKADLGTLNLAAVLTDGSQVVVARQGAGGSSLQPGQPGQVSAPGSGSPKLNLNSATAEQLEQLPGVGPVTAASIVAWRDQHGRFTRVDELQEVDGIGPKTFARLEPHVTV